jgi:nucleoside-diphosphate-sugar epimerase
MPREPYDQGSFKARSRVLRRVRVLVVGGTRFIGRHTVEELLRRGHEVTIFHRGKTLNPFGARVSERLGDRLDRDSVASELGGQRFDGVVDIAYVWSAGTGAHEISYVVDALQASALRYVYLSSVSVYDIGPLSTTEDGTRAPSLGSYSEDKIGAEDYLLAEHRADRLVASIIRPPFVYGPWNDLPRESWFWDRILAGRSVIVPGDGQTLFQWVAAKDVAWGLAECLENPQARGEAFNIAEEGAISHAAFVDRLAQVAGRLVEKVFVPRERIQDLGGSLIGRRMYFGATLDVGVDAYVSIEKAKRQLGFRPTNPLEGLAETFQWYMEHDRGREPKFSFDKLVLGR